MKIFTKLIVATLLSSSFLFTSFSSLAGVVVIVHPSNENAIDNKLIKRIYLGKAKKYPNGNQIIALNQTHGSAITNEFSDKVLSKSASQLKAYWSKLIFTGKGTPPSEMDGDAAVINSVANNPDTIGYISSDAVNDKIKVIGTF
jgi:ABC-type phosphate transport system substrate-binding protein